MKNEKSLEYREMSKKFNRTGGMILLYTLLITVFTAVIMIAKMVLKIIGGMNPNEVVNDLQKNVSYYDTGIGEIIAVVIGFLIILVWKKRDYIKNVIFKKQKNMTKAEFFKILPVFFMGQLIMTVFFIVFEKILNAAGLSINQNVNMISSVTHKMQLSMIIYAGILGPIAEEIWFRGILLRAVSQYNKKAAIIISSVMFGLFHENFVQGVLAFFIGLVLAYVALEYSIKHCIILHIINNLLFAQIFTFALSYLSDEKAQLIIISAKVILFILGAVVLWLNRQKIKQNINNTAEKCKCTLCFFTRPWNIVLIIWYLIICLSGIKKL